MTLHENNKVVHGLWVGSELSPLEMLTLLSFVRNGHEFHLWTYDEFRSPVPDGVTLCDAASIIPKEWVFRRKYDDPLLGIGKGSVGSPFSDLFRYRLLYEHGGWWTDMDITCLRPLSFDSPYYFRAHPILPLIGNVMKVPARSVLMETVYNEVAGRCNEDTLDWLLPNRILNHHVAELGLHHYVRNGDGPRDWWEEISPMVTGRRTLRPEWHYVHWMNEEWRSRGLNKDDLIQGTTLGGLASMHGLPVRRPSLKERIKLAFT